jgi:hypothetical protein
MRRAALVACGLVLALVAAEVALRVYGFGRGIRHRPHTARGWEMVPNQRAFNVRGRTPVRTNALGFRGPDIEVPRPASTLRLLFLGDGTTLNNQTPEAATFPFLVRDALASRRPGGEVDIAVGAVSGYQLEQELELLRADAGRLRPSVVIVGFSWNDWTETTMRGPGLGPEAYGDYTDTQTVWQRTALYDFGIRLQRVWGRRQQARAYARGERLPPADTDDVAWRHVETTLDSMAAVARRADASMLLLVLPARITQHDTDTFAARRARLLDWAARRGVVCADPEAAFAAAAARGEALFLDELHLAAAAQPLVAATVVEALAAAHP